MTYADAFELGITFLDIELRAEAVRYRAALSEPGGAIGLPGALR